MTTRRSAGSRIDPRYIFIFVYFFSSFFLWPKRRSDNYSLNRATLNVTFRLPRPSAPPPGPRPRPPRSRAPAPPRRPVGPAGAPARWPPKLEPQERRHGGWERACARVDVRSRGGPDAWASGPDRDAIAVGPTRRRKTPPPPLGRRGSLRNLSAWG